MKRPKLRAQARIGIESGSEHAFDFMVKYGIRGVSGGGSAEGGAVERHMIGFQQAYARHGIKLELDDRLPIPYRVLPRAGNPEAASSPGWINPAALHPCASTR